MNDVSVFNNAFSKYPSMSVGIETIFKSIKTGSFKDDVIGYRQTRNKAFKTSLPCFTPSGVFSIRCDDNIELENGIICIDIDYKDNPDIDFDSIKKILINSKHCLCVHMSVGGEGLAVYYKIKDYKRENHSLYYEYFEAQFLGKLNVTIDKSCKNISRLRFVSYDKDLYYEDKNEVEIKIEPKKIYEKTNYNNSSRIITLANRIIDVGIDICDDYNDWIRVCFSLAKTLGEEGRPYFHRISEIGIKYDFKACERLYDYAIRNEQGSRENFVYDNTLFYIAKSFGITINN